MAIPKVHVIRLLPTGNSPAARTERTHLQASKWLIPGAPGGEGIAGRPYLVTIDIAASLLRKEWVLCDAAGKQIDGELPKSDQPAPLRNGTAEWFALPLDQRPGTEEFREAQFQKKLQEAYAAEQAILAEAHIAGTHKDSALEDCPLCAGLALDAVAQPQQGVQGGGTGTEGSPVTQSGDTGAQTAPDASQATSSSSDDTSKPPAEGTEITDQPPPPATGGSRRAK